MSETGQLRDAGWTCAWRVWLTLTGLAVVTCLAVYLSGGLAGLFALVKNGPLSIPEQTAACVAVSWLAWGASLALLKSPRIRTEHGMAIACSLVLLILYVNFLRERIQYADLDDYLRAVFDLHEGIPFHARYLYPPLLATLGQPLVPLGANAVTALLWSANLVSLVAFFWLLGAALERYGFGRRLASVTAFLFMVVNVPILRTLGYVQINLHVINLILLAFLLFPRHRIVSALALALAVHLKVSPLVLAIPFLFASDRTWLAAFLAGMIGMAGITFATYGWAPFASFLNNAGHIYAANAICFRDNSIDSLIRGAGIWAGTDTTSLVPLFKVPLVMALIGCAAYVMRGATFVARTEAGREVLNGLPAWSLVMVFASPLVWEHHLVLLAIAFLVVVRKLKTPAEWVAYSFAYLLTFLLPTFDFYPLSFGRLFSAAALTVLMVRSCRNRDAGWMDVAEGRLDAFFRGGAQCA